MYVNETFNLYNERYCEALNNRVFKNKQGFRMLLQFMEEFSDFMYQQIHTIFEPNCKTNKDFENEIRRICIDVENRIYPQFFNIYKEYNKLIIGDNDEEIYKQYYASAEDRLYSIVACRNLKWFAYYLERGKRNKLWAKTMTIFENYYWYAQRMILLEDIETIRASYFPGAGKTYACNITCAFWLGYDNEMTFLRITYSDDLAKQFTRQIVDIILTPEYKKVFPKFDKEEKDLFSVANAGGFKLAFSSVHNFYATTTNGQSTGKRAKCLMIDDVSKGQEEAYNIDVHNGIVDKFDSNWTTRTDEDKQYQIIAGTMWSPYDLLNVIYERAKKYGKMIESTRFKYTMVNNENEKLITRVFIAVPILDYKTDESTCPLRYSTEKMREKRDTYRDKDLFEAVYQQRPVEPEALIFAWSRLNTYEKLPFTKDMPYQTYAMIDPAKKGKNYVAMGICRRWQKIDGTWSKWYLIDCIYKLDTVENLYPMIVDKIVRHQIDRVGGELNTNSSLLYVLKEKCSERGYTTLKTDEVWTYEQKEMKISGARNGIREEIVYPSQKMYSLKSDMGLGMAHLTTWDISGKNAYDDFPDMISMFVIQYCGEERGNSMQVLDRNKFI